MRNLIATYAIAASIGLNALLAAPANFTSTVQTHDTATGTNSKFTSQTLSSGQLEEKCRVDQGAKPSGGGTLDPRVERHYTHAIPSNTTDDYEWKGFVIIDNAKDTTFFQLLNTDDSDPDKHRPVLFLEAHRFTNSSGQKILRVTDGRESDGAPLIFSQTNDNNFHLRVKIIDGKKAEVYVDNVKKYTKNIDRYTDQSGQQLGDRTKVRYGVYHHDTKVVGPSGNRTKEALSMAQVRVRDPQFKRL